MSEGSILLSILHLKRPVVASGGELWNLALGFKNALKHPQSWDAVLPI